MMVDRVFDNRQPQAAAPRLPGAGFIHPIETLGQTGNMLRGNAWPIIFDAEQRPPCGVRCQLTRISVPGGVWFTAL